jgi:cytochrome c biogenesis factor
MIDPVMISMIAVLVLMCLFSIFQNLTALKTSESSSRKMTARLMIAVCFLVLLIAGQLAVYELEGQHEKTRQLCRAMLMMGG